MKEYTIIDTSGSAIASSGTESGSVALENPGVDTKYTLLVKGDISDLDVDVDIEVPDDAEQYDTAVTFTTLDLSDGGEARDSGNSTGLRVLRSAGTIHVTVTNQSASAGDATVKLLQYAE